MFSITDSIASLVLLVFISALLWREFKTRTRRCKDHKPEMVQISVVDYHLFSPFTFCKLRWDSIQRHCGTMPYDIKRVTTYQCSTCGRTREETNSFSVCRSCGSEWSTDPILSYMD